MHIYWRIMQDLRELGEMIVFTDPSLLREYKRWCRRNRITVGAEEINIFLFPLYN